MSIFNQYDNPILGQFLGSQNPGLQQLYHNNLTGLQNMNCLPVYPRIERASIENENNEKLLLLLDE